MLDKWRIRDESQNYYGITLIYKCGNVGIFLPPANEVWGKVIFSQVCVKNSVQWRGACSGGGVWSWGLRGSWGGSGPDPHPRGIWPGRVCGLPPTATAVGGTHPTGMHSCLLLKFENQGSICCRSHIFCLRHVQRQNSTVWWQTLHKV